MNSLTHLTDTHTGFPGTSEIGGPKWGCLGVALGLGTCHRTLVLPAGKQPQLLSPVTRALGAAGLEEAQGEPRSALSAWRNRASPFLYWSHHCLKASIFLLKDMREKNSNYFST